MTLDLNEYVTFTPTTLGWQLLDKAEERVSQMETKPSNMSKKIPYYYNKQDNGEVSMLLWKVIEVFGKDMSLQMEPFSKDNKIAKAS